MLSLLAVSVIAMAAVPALADPPTRAARIAFASDSAAFSPAGSDDWVQARTNRPIWVGDRVWTGNGRLEIQLGGAALRLAPRTSLQVLSFDDRIAQFELTQGSVALHVRAIGGNDSIEIATPSFAFVARERGDYRIDVDRDETAVSARRGSADIYGQDVSYRIDRRERFVFHDPDLRDFDAVRLPRPDEFDRWVQERAQREERSTSARYVSPEMIGFVDLDSHGEWRTDNEYGNVWIPRVAGDWAPYRDGHWSWVDPWGWTWIDDAPWGYAPSHYGRWARIGPQWAWVPGPRNVAPVYAPALVAWVGGDNFSITVSAGATRGIGWFPLAPGEVWRPTYDVSREYFTRANVSNTVVNNTTIVNIYNDRHQPRGRDVQYRHRERMMAVPVQTLVESRPVRASAAQLGANAAAQANILLAAPAQPTAQSFFGGSPRSQAKPPAESMQRPVVARTAPTTTTRTLEDRAAMVREGKPADRSAPERPAPGAKPGAERPTSAAPAGRPSSGEPSGQVPGQAQAGKPPPDASATKGTASNVRIVDADKAKPRPLPASPSTEGRAAKDDGKTPQVDRRPASQAGTDGAARPPRPAPAGEGMPPGKSTEAIAPERGRTISPGPDKGPRVDTAKPAAPVSPPAAKVPPRAVPTDRGERATPPGSPTSRPDRTEPPASGVKPALPVNPKPAPAAKPAPSADPAPQVAPAPVASPPAAARPPSRPSPSQPGAGEAGAAKDGSRGAPAASSRGSPGRPPADARPKPAPAAPGKPDAPAEKRAASPPPAAAVQSPSAPRPDGKGSPTASEAAPKAPPRAASPPSTAKPAPAPGNAAPASPAPPARGAAPDKRPDPNADRADNKKANRRDKDDGDKKN